MKIIELFEETIKMETLYCKRDILNGKDIVKWAKEQGFTSCVSDDMHVTIVYSKTKIDWNEIEENKEKLIIKGGKRTIKLFGDDKDAVVLTFESKELDDRWHEFIDKFGATSDYSKLSAHITISYDGLPKDLKLSDIEPYEGNIKLGPEKFSPIKKNWSASIDEKKLDESYHIRDVHDLQSFYHIFKTSYEKETGSSWGYDKLMSRARDWTFYGDEKGFVAVRVQASGMKKLVATAGDFRSVLKGFAELQAEGGPIWGAVSAALAAISKKCGMIAPHKLPGAGLFIKAIIATIPDSVFGGHKPDIMPDGGMKFNYEDTGESIKYLIGNKEYFKEMLKQPHIRSMFSKVPGLEAFLKMMGFGS
jgi:hypothetical protein